MSSRVSDQVRLKAACSATEARFIQFTASAFHKLMSIYVFSYFPFDFEGRMWDLIVSVPGHCLSFYFEILVTETRDITLSRQRTTKVLIRLRGCSHFLMARLIFIFIFSDCLDRLSLVERSYFILAIFTLI